MGDSAEFEKLGALEARLASALDRIARGLDAGAVGGVGFTADGPPVASPASSALAAAEAARDEAEARARDLALRVEALEARLAETQDALGGAEAKLAESGSAADAGAGRIAELEEHLAAREAQISALTEARDALEARVADLQKAAEETPGDGERIAELEHENGLLKRRVERAREERAEALAARDAAQDLAEELGETSGLEPDARALALRAEVRRLKRVVDEMSQGLDEMRAGTTMVADGEAGTNGQGALTRALEAQVAALTEARRAEAAELDRILAELTEGEGPSQEEAGHA
ncbi:hypothetical protein N8I71_18160 [Roseibacterium sp. SDUM158016]|uniref:hypothetical protein n=1 Tax=Roseicyclus sediminis TaxID=2980997 RepID=UPI0021D0B3D6|nr:hypothetical protein [Roseibacterium sp. SDUM158016]MCU4654767.1 hypothetical protein [Roseibacterium sp. SDUM158016]